MLNGAVFSLFVVLPYLCRIQKETIPHPAMEPTTWDKLFFLDSPGDFDAARHADCVLHILCTQGSMSFLFRETRYHIAARDYVILPNPALASDFAQSADFDSVTLCLSEPFVAAAAIRSNYGIAGHLALLQNPVMRLSDHDYRICLSDLWKLRERLGETSHLFREEMLGHLLTVHILDLYDIHARECGLRQVPEQAALLLRRFVELLARGDYRRHRDLGYYAAQLCITPHYLSEICKRACGRPASYWIDRFTIREISRLLCRRELTLTEIAGRLDFSSLSYFSRYVQKQIGMSPTEYRNSLGRKDGKQG